MTENMLFWKDPNVDGMPIEEGQYLVIINSTNGECCWPEICYHEKNKKSFTTFDYYNDCAITYKKKDVKYWMKIPDYK